ncbi:MAG: glutamate racemase [Acidimicrobiia bacterium]|nr:glutamate racemase [Acidimicrobiia bacterium]MCY4458614.1 glutamate racemase [Acidimicrobiaceae bacterium]
MFDSGFGGLTVARAVIDLLPNENLIYFADTGRFPYGSRSAAEVTDFSNQIADLLLTQHRPKLIVVACNTASAVALGELAARVDVPVIGVLRPGLESLLKVTVTSRVAVIATVGTIASGAYQRLAAQMAPQVELSCAACPGFVEFVERGETDSDQVRVLAQRLLAPLREAKVDALLLACTHYPFLARPIAEVMGRDVVLVSSADETAFAVQRTLRSLGQSRDCEEVGTHRFVSSGDADSFARLGRILLGSNGPELNDVECHPW